MRQLFSLIPASALLLASFVPSAACSLPTGAVPPWLPQPRLDRAGHGDAAWVARAGELREIARAKRSDVVFVGDSITAGWLEQGAPVWRARFATATNLGLPGDTTQNLLARIDDGLFDDIRPRLVFLLIGTNDISRPDQIACWSAKDVLRGILAVEHAIAARLPAATIVLVTLPPNFGPDAGGTPFDRLVELVDAKLPRPLVDIHAVLARAVATRRSPPVLERDGIHLSAAGYRLVGPLFSRLIADNQARRLKG